jgi:hypothetical protein
MGRKWQVRERGAESELAPVDSNHHYRIQSPVSCHWTRGHQILMN